MFNKNSGLVKIWVSMILLGTYTYAQCPNLSNLREIILEVLLSVGYDPDPISVPNVSADDNLNQIIGISDLMEYSFDDVNYTIYDSSNLPDLSGNLTVYVRVSATSINLASLPTVLIFTINPVTPDAPDVTNDDSLNTVSGMTTLMSYDLDSVGYVVYDETTFNAIDFSGNHTLLVVVSATDINLCSLPTTLTFTTND